MIEWDLKDLYKNEKVLEKSVKKTKKDAESFEKKYKNKLSKFSKDEFLDLIREYEDILSESAKAVTYAFLKFAKDSQEGAFYAKYQKEYSDISEKLLFFELEFNKLPKKRQNAIIKKAKGYEFFLSSLQQQKPYQLSNEEERILLKKDLTSSSAFSRLFDEHFSRMKFTYGREKLNEEKVLSLLHSPKRETRRKAADSLTKGLKPDLHLFSYIFNMIKTDLKTECDLRDYKNVEDPRHIDNKITKKSVDALIKTTHKNFDLSIEYYKIKRKLLGYQRLYDYDRYAPFNESEEEFDFERSKQIVLSAFKDFNPKFYKIAKEALEKGWCDVYPKEGKRGGAFSHPATPDTHPYVLLNHTNQRRDLFTMAHELGHAIHQYLSRDVGYLGSDTPLTTSETASVFAEMLVFDYIKNNLKSSELISLYGGKLEDIFATLFRQIIFTTFERRVHSHEGEISIDTLKEYWIQENKKMFGSSVTLTKNYKIWWSYIPHFIHSPFYCYAYGYGQLLVLALYSLYKKSDANFVKNYTKFLSLGGSKSPKEMIKIFGFDIESSDFWQLGINEIKNLMEEFKKLTQEKGA